MTKRGMVMERDRTVRPTLLMSIWHPKRWSHCSVPLDRKSTRLNSSHLGISYAVFCLKKKKQYDTDVDEGTATASLGKFVSAICEVSKTLPPLRGVYRTQQSFG